EVEERCCGAVWVGEVADIRLERLPLAGNAFIGREGVAGAEPRNQELSAILEARFVKVDQQRLVHSDWLHKFEVIEAAGSAAFLRGDAELIAECAGERLVRAVPGVERDRDDVGRAGSQ